MVSHSTLGIDPLGGGSVIVNGIEVTEHIEGADLIVRPGQPTVLRLYVTGSADVTVDGVVEVHHEADAGDAQSEVGAILRDLDGAGLWNAMLADVTVDHSDLAGSFLHYVAEQIDPQP